MTRVLFHGLIQGFRGRIGNMIFRQLPDGTTVVTSAQVTVLDEEGKVLEKGDAVRGEGDWWEFASHTEGKTVKAEAWDLPGHVTRVVV